MFGSMSRISLPRNILSNSFLFSGLDPKEVDIVVMAMEEANFGNGQRVIQKGDDGDCLYVIESGTLVLKTFCKSLSSC